MTASSYKKVGEVEIHGRRARSGNALLLLDGHTATNRLIAHHFESCVGLPQHEEGVWFERVFGSHLEAIQIMSKIHADRNPELY